MNSRIYSAVVAIFLLPASASASTVELLLTADAGLDRASSYFREDTLYGADSFTVLGSQKDIYEASTFASGSASAERGQLRFLIDGTYTCEVENCGASYGASALSRVDETFLVSGTGTLTAVMQVDANWLATRYNFAASMSLSAATGARAGDEISYNYISSSGGRVVNDMLLAEISFTNAVNVNVNAFWRMQGDISAASSYAGVRDAGFMNASNTGTFFVSASDGLSFTAGDAGFLSDAAYPDLVEPAPVPLPAGAALMLSALGGLAALRRLKRA